MPRVRRRARRFEFTESCRKHLIVGNDPSRFSEHFAAGYGRGLMFDRDAAHHDWAQHGEQIMAEMEPYRPWAAFVFDDGEDEDIARRLFAAQFERVP